MRSALVLLASLLIFSGCGSGGGRSAGGGTGVPLAPGPPGVPPSGATGSWSARFLGSGTYRSLLVEVDYVAGFQPQAATLALLQTRLQERCQLPDGIVVTLGNEITSGARPVYSVADNASLEAANRGTFASGTQAALYVVFLNGRSDQDGSSGSVLGWAYTGTSIGIFEETIRNAATLLVPASEIERSVLVHEAGHVLGLVNLGAPLTSSHHDAPNGAHCTTPSCVMNFQIDTSDVIQLAQNLGQLPDDFNGACLQDLRAGGGR